jgi:hypothetical protein
MRRALALINSVSLFGISGRDIGPVFEGRPPLGVAPSRIQQRPIPDITYSLGGKDQHGFAPEQKAQREVVPTGGNLGRHVINRGEQCLGTD